MADAELLRRYFREATGQAQIDEHEETTRGRWPIHRAISAVLTPFGDGFVPSGYRMSEGSRWLTQLVDEEKGKTYPLTSLSFQVDGKNGLRRFTYRGLFNGEEVGEKGKADLPYESGKIYLKGGDEEALLEIAETGHIIHWPEKRGIPIEVELTGMYGRRTRDVVARWFPDLTNEPLIYSQPDGGRINWSPPHGQ